MTFHITIGWWLLPLLITAASFAWAVVESKADAKQGDGLFGGFTVVLAVMFRMPVAAAVSLLAWLIWALCC